MSIIHFQLKQCHFFLLTLHIIDDLGRFIIPIKNLGKTYQIHFPDLICSQLHSGAGVCFWSRRFFPANAVPFNCGLRTGCHLHSKWSLTQIAAVYVGGYYGLFIKAFPLLVF